MGKAGVPAEYHLYPKGSHGLSLANETLMRADGTGVQKECQSWMPLLNIWLKNACKRK